MSKKLQKRAQIVEDKLISLGYDELKIIELEVPARTARQAADELGCGLGQIANSLIFKGTETNKPILILTSGANRVDEKAVKKFIGEELARVGAKFVLEATGFPIGGIPPIAHKTEMDTYIDEDLFKYEEIWAAGGTPETLFKLTPKILEDITGGRVISVK